MGEIILVPTGNIIKEYLEEHNITQKELAQRINISEKHISNVIKGKSRLTEDFALKLEKILTDVPASYWLNYESKYREQLAREEELQRINNWDLQEISKRFRFKEVFKGLDLSLVQQAIEMLKLLKISDFDNFEKVYDKIAVEFMEDGGEKEAIAIWLNMCETEIEIQNNDISNVSYKETEFRKNLNKFKLLSNNNTDLSIKSCRKLCNKLGVYLVFCEPVVNSKVRGALTTYNNHPVIYISGRFKSHTHIWFAFIHEVGHLLLHYNKEDIFVSGDKVESEDIKENQANDFARNFFIDSIRYKDFCNGEISADTIRKFAKEQNTLPEFVVDILQHDEKIGYGQFNYLH